MSPKILIAVLFGIWTMSTRAQSENFTKEQIKEDLQYLANTLNEKSSYVYLNGYDFNKDFEQYLKTKGDTIALDDFGLFLTRTLAKIGDRHSSVNTIRGYSLNESRFLPFIYAPLDDKVVVLNQDANKNLKIRFAEFPYLKKIDGTAINDFLQKNRPEDIEAPKETYFTMAVRDIRDIQKNYRLINEPLPKEMKLTLSDATFRKDTTIVVPIIEKSERLRPWDEKFEREYIGTKDEDFNKPEVIKKLFDVKDGIAYIKIPAMVSKNEAPLLFDKVNSFMQSIENNSNALIIDVRSNGGGTRDLIYEFAKYLVHPDSVYVVNATRQRGPLPLSKEYKERLNTRYLYAYSELGPKEQNSVKEFLKTFEPIYRLDDEKYSEYHFGLLNGTKLSEKSYHYDEAVYILANEKTFSAASVFVSVFKGIPNVQIAGVTTDGSSGNSEWFDLPVTKLFGKISTMVSFQKNGKILDGFGTKPDIPIKRDMGQILWKSDTQLEKLRSLILQED
ncbi:S41 family peptidase [Flagellimonas crocea]|uniref:S41 family peptidase n=1 Tax=Flagellimonas crocea TaxID=3067311 RepID=UPI00296F4776|nr:S41 family peptidase [Muricauda sp. DH64]